MCHVTEYGGGSRFKIVLATDTVDNLVLFWEVKLETGNYCAMIRASDSPVNLPSSKNYFILRSNPSALSTQCGVSFGFVMVFFCGQAHFIN